MKKIFFLLFLFLVFLPSSFAKNNILTIGVSFWGSSEIYQHSVDGFIGALSEEGFEEGKNLKFLYRNAETNLDRQLAIAEEFVREKVDLIYSLTTPGTLVVKATTSKIPLVFSIVTYPKEVGLINSEVSSGNNLTGTRNYIKPSRQYYYFNLLKPNLSSILFIHRKGEPNSEFQYIEFRDFLKKRSVAIDKLSALNLSDLQSKLKKKIASVEAIYLACDTLIQTGGDKIIIDFAEVYNIPVFACTEGAVSAGALIGNIPSYYDLGKISGKKASLILQGVKPSQISIDSPMEDNIILNLKTASKLGIDVPSSILKKSVKIIYEK